MQAAHAAEQCCLAAISLCADYGEFFLGTPAKQFTGCFDTGSSDTWLPSVMCFDPSCTSHDRFNPSDSSSFKVLHPAPPQHHGTGSSSLRQLI